MIQSGKNIQQHHVNIEAETKERKTPTGGIKITFTEFTLTQYEPHVKLQQKHYERSLYILGLHIINTQINCHSATDEIPLYSPTQAIF